MSEKESENKKWTDPKDFGLPFVEINPIHQVVHPSASDPSNSEPEVGQPDDKQNSVNESEIKKNHQVNHKKTKLKKTTEKKSSNSWVWTVLALTLISIGVILWQLQLENSLFTTSKPEKISQSQDTSLEKQITQEVQPIPIEEPKDAELKDTVSTIINSTTPVSKDSETGTTIAKESKDGNLIRIDSKAEKVRHFVVVASLPNEKLALEMVEKFSGKSAELYLIMPYDSNPNYRIAVSQFRTWKAASDEAARIRPQFSEDLWILSY